MRISVRRMRNSAGIILPKPVLAELGVKAGDDLSLTLEGGGLAVLTPAKVHPAGATAPAHSFGIGLIKWGKLHDMGPDGDAP